MSEEIIIDGVNVARCAYITYRDSNNPICSETGQRFNGYDICYFKQLKRLEQERDELQDKYSKMIHKYNDLYKKYRAKEILEPDLKNEIKKFDALSIKYGQALEEIRKLVKEQCESNCGLKLKYCMKQEGIKTCLIYKIKNEINEVLNDRD